MNVTYNNLSLAGQEAAALAATQFAFVVQSAQSRGLLVAPAPATTPPPQATPPQTATTHSEDS